MLRFESMGRSPTEEFSSRLGLLADRFGGKRAFARAAGLPYSSFLRYFGESDPTRTVIEKIARTGNVSADWLLFGLDGSQKNGEADWRFRSRVSRQLSEKLHSLLSPQFTPADLAELCGVQQESIHEILDGSEPTSEELVGISRGLGICVEVLLAKESVEKLVPKVCPSRWGHFTLVPRFSLGKFWEAVRDPGGQYLSRDPSLILSNLLGNDEDGMPVRTSMIRERLAADPKNLVYEVVDSNELKSRIPYGSYVLIDLSNTDFRPGIYLVAWGDSKHFREYCKISDDGSRVAFRSEDPDEPTIEMESSKFIKRGAVVGRVVWFDLLAKSLTR